MLLRAIVLITTLMALGGCEARSLRRIQEQRLKNGLGVHPVRRSTDEVSFEGDEDEMRRSVDEIDDEAGLDDQLYVDDENYAWDEVPVMLDQGYFI